jgi:hypothetical protein
VFGGDLEEVVAGVAEALLALGAGALADGLDGFDAERLNDGARNRAGGWSGSRRIAV